MRPSITSTPWETIEDGLEVTRPPAGATPASFETNQFQSDRDEPVREGNGTSPTQRKLGRNVLPIQTLERPGRGTFRNGSILMDQLVVFACTPEDREALAPLLAEHLGITRTDAAIQARLAPGVVRGEYSPQQAAAAAAMIQRLGLQARVIPGPDVPVLHPQERVHHLRWPGGGLLVLDSLGIHAETIPWDHLDLVSVGLVVPVAAKSAAARSTTVLATGRQHLTEESTATSPPQLELLLICRAPFRVLRLEAPHLNYEFLGTRGASGSAGNFRLMVADILAQAPHVYRTPATRAWLRGDPAASYRYDSAGELERTTQLHLLIHRQAHGSGDKEGNRCVP